MLRQLTSTAIAMSRSKAATSSPFTQAVVAAMRKLYPEELAEKSFDNTGLLLEAPFNPQKRQRNSVLLTIDLTKAVADEAIRRKDSVVVTYHPIIFKGLKSLTLADTQQQSLLRLAFEGISVYSPHTAVDSVPGGLCDWLADIISGTVSSQQDIGQASSLKDEATSETERPEAVPESPSESERTQSKEPSKKPPQPPRGPNLPRTYSNPTYPSSRGAGPQRSHESPHSRSTIVLAAKPPEGFEGAGAGRLVTLSSRQPLTQLVERIARGVGTPAGFPVAVPQGAAIESLTIRTVAVCPGSGSSVFRGLGPDGADLLFTGELSHHDALAATERGSSIVTLFHSNSERGYLDAVMREKVEVAVKQQWSAARQTTETDGAKDEAAAEVFDNETVRVDVSQVDRDPYGIVLLQDTKQKGTVLGGDGDNA